MDCDAFLRTPATAAVRVHAGEWLLACGKLALGVVTLWGVVPALPHVALQGWAGMTGILLLLHFGLFDVLSCAWRTVGLQAVPIMNRPLAATSLGEFWGRRWNVAFRDLTHQFFFAPLQGALGPGAALLAGFLVSGLIHDLVISWPSGAGWGLPTLYFALQGAGLLFERSRAGRACGLKSGGRGRLYCIAFVLLPSPLLFHWPFVTGVVAPFLKAIGAAP
jgi:hypothetical protein